MKTKLETLKKHAAKPADLDGGFNTDSRGNKTPVVYTFSEQFEETEAHKILGLRYTGWFTNEYGWTYKDGSGICVGIVAEFPPRPDFPSGWFLAGYLWGDNGERVFYLDVYGDREEAAMDADHYAQQFAEVEREHNAKWNKARQIEDDIEEALQRLRECLALRHRKCLDYVRGEARKLCETIRDKREELRTDYADCL